jgi:hypothetical protein
MKHVHKHEYAGFDLKDMQQEHDMQHGHGHAALTWPCGADIRHEHAE